MDRLENALLRLRAAMVIKQVEKRLKFCPEGEKRTGLSIRAFYLGQEHKNAGINPFSDIDHRYKDDLVKGFSDGSTVGTSDGLNRTTPQPQVSPVNHGRTFQ